MSLGRHGAVVLKWGFPATHCFAQVRVIFEVARSRSRELFNPSGWDCAALVERRGRLHPHARFDDLGR